MFWGGGPKPFILLKYSALVLFFVILKNTNPRVRIDQSVRFFWTKMAAAAAIALVLAVIGF